MNVDDKSSAKNRMLRILEKKSFSVKVECIDNVTKIEMSGTAKCDSDHKKAVL